MVTWHKFKMAAISTENSSKIYLQFLFSIEHLSWLSSRKANSCTFMYVYITTADKKHKKLGKWHKIVQQFKRITSEVLNYIIADTRWELVCNGKFHVGIDTAYIIHHWYLNDKSFPLRSHGNGYSQFSLAPLFLRTITFILIIISSFILIMFGERIKAHGFAITVWRERLSCRMTATCMTAASFPDSFALAVDDVHEGRRSCWSSCNAWSWHTPCTTDQLPPVSSDVNSRRSLLVCCLPEHYLVVCSQDVIWQLGSVGGSFLRHTAFPLVRLV